jgi:type IV secretory pathway VirB4 component
MYEIPQQLEYKEKIVFGLTFRQLAYALGFAIFILLIFKANINFYSKFVLSMPFVCLAVGFMFFNLEGILKDWIIWYKFRELKSDKQKKKERKAKEKAKGIKGNKKKKKEFKNDIKDFFGIERIKNKLIHTKKKKLAVLKVEAINFDIKPKKEKQTITLAFQKLLNSLDFPIQILMRTENLSLEEYLESLKQRVDKKSIKIFNEYQEHIKDTVSSKGVLNRNFYLIIPETTDINIQLKVCEDRLHGFNLKTRRLNSWELRKLFVQMFNTKGLVLPNLIKNNPDHLKINNRLNRTIYAHGYPRIVESGFLDRIISSLGDFDLSLHIDPCSLENTMILLNKELQKQRADLYSAKLKNQLNPSLEIKYKDTLKILENLQKGNEKLFNINLCINCKANNKKDLDLLTKKVESELNALLIIPRQPNFRMLQGFKSCFPLNENSLKVKKNITTHGLSAFFPFTSSFFKFDKTGIWLGLNKNNIPIIRDIFKLSNANGVCLATSGAGKSYLTKLFISRYLLNGTKVMIIDPQGEYRKLVKKFKGQRINLSRKSKTIINPLDLMGHTYPDKRLTLMDLMPIMLGELTEPQKSFIDKALTQAYQSKGIYMNRQETWKRKPPILRNLLEALKEIEKKSSNLEKLTLRSLINRLNMYVFGVFAFLNRETDINFNKNLVCFDIGKMPKQVQPTMMFLVLDYVYSKMKKSLKRKLLVVDEAWSLLSKTRESSYIFEIVKTCRKFNLGLLLLNQEVEDMINSKAGRSVLANSSYTLLLKQKPAVIDSIQKTFHLSNSERMALLTAMTGEGILIMEDEHSHIKIVASKQEHELITTNADEILKRGDDEEEEPVQKERKKKKKKREPKVRVDKDKGLYKRRNLKKLDIEYLREHGYKEFLAYSIMSNKKEKYFIRPRFNESSQHCFLVYDLANYIKKFTKKVQLFQTKKPDIVFKINRKEYAIEVETGKALEYHPKQLKEKVKRLNKVYKDRWFFVVTNKKLTSKYNKLGPTCDNRTIKTKILKIVRNS